MHVSDSVKKRQPHHRITTNLFTTATCNYRKGGREGEREIERERGREKESERVKTGIKKAL